MIGQRLLVLAVIATAGLQSVPAALVRSFAIHRHSSRRIHRRPTSSLMPVLSQRTIASAPPVQSIATPGLRSFFGLGPGELVIIAIAGVILVGPSKLSQLSKEAGSVAGKMGDEWSELKAIPEEFQKGLEEGEVEARSRKAKDMEPMESITEEERGK